MTSAEAVTKALRRLGIVSHNTPATADQISTGVDALNLMLGAFKAHSADLEHVDLGLNDSIALSPEYHQDVVDCLAWRLMPEYPGSTTADARGAFRTLQAHFFVATPAEIAISGMFTRNRSIIQ